MTTFTKSGLAAAVLACAACLPLHASAALFDDNEARKAILELRAKVEALRTELNGRIDTKAEKTISLDIVNNHEATLAEIAKLRGQIEVLANEISKVQKSQRDLYQDLDARLRKLEPRQVTIDGKETAVELPEQKAYDAAMQLFKNNDYKNAIIALNDFLRQYPESGYVANVQFLLGTTYYAQKDCASAIPTYQAFVKAFPDSPRAPDAMVGTAQCQREAKAVIGLKKTLQELVAAYPGSEQAASAREQLKKLK